MTSTIWPVHHPFAQVHFHRGKATGLAKSILLILEARGIHIPDDIRDRITTCTDTDQLDHCIRRAVVIDHAGELFDGLSALSTWPVHSPSAREHFGRGEAESLTKSVLLFLEARCIHVSDDIRDRITGCTDTDRLERWVQRAGVINDVHELFD